MKKFNKPMLKFRPSNFQVFVALLICVAFTEHSITPVMNIISILDFHIAVMYSLKFISFALILFTGFYLGFYFSTVLYFRYDLYKQYKAIDPKTSFFMIMTEH